MQTLNNILFVLNNGQKEMANFKRKKRGKSARAEIGRRKMCADALNSSWNVQTECVEAGLPPSIFQL